MVVQATQRALPARRAPQRALAALRALRAPVTAALRAPFARRTWAELCYSVVSVPVALVAFVFVVVFLVLGVVLVVTFVGLPLIALDGLAARAFGRCY
ncbi:MAG TPA: sensor domain-containing protein, partial [Acidimicrobiales bacterium]